MTSRNAIARACLLRPNMIDEEILADSLMDLEGDIAEMMRKEQPENLWPEEQELLMPAPKDGCYVYYLCAMIDFINQDTALYANDAAMSQEAIAEARQWWWRTHGPYEDKVEVETEEEDTDENTSTDAE